jgi:hypothetical protein
MQEYTLISIYGILTAIIILSVFVIRKERKIIVEAEVKMKKEVADAQEVLDKFYSKLDEFISGVQEIADKSKEDSIPQ